MNHKWGKETKKPGTFRVYLQTCEKCGFTRGVMYHRSSAEYFVPNGAAYAKIPPCTGKKS